MNKYTFAFVLCVLFSAVSCRADTPDVLHVYIGPVTYQWSGHFTVAEIHGDSGFLEFDSTASVGDEIKRASFEPRIDEPAWEVFVIGSEQLRISANCSSQSSVSDHIEVELMCDAVP